jgi:hypothetical protein
VAEGVAEYDGYDYGGWLTVNGTNIGAPFLAGVMALAGNATRQDGGRTFWLTAHRRYLYRVTQNDNYVRFSYGGGWERPRHRTSVVASLRRSLQASIGTRFHHVSTGV